MASRPARQTAWRGTSGNTIAKTRQGHRFPPDAADAGIMAGKKTWGSTSALRPGSHVPRVVWTGQTMGYFSRPCGFSTSSSRTDQQERPAVTHARPIHHARRFDLSSPNWHNGLGWWAWKRV